MTAAPMIARAAAAVAVADASVEGDPHGWRDAAIVAAVNRAVALSDDAFVLEVAARYDQLLLHVPQRSSSGAVSLIRAGTGERRRRGSFATPPALAATLARHALPEIDLDRRAQRGPAVVDPACGAGALLRAAFARLLRLGHSPGAAIEAMHGVDADGAAIVVCRAVLAVDARRAGAQTRSGAPLEAAALAERIVVGDALLGPTPHQPTAAGRDPVGLSWHNVFADVLDRSDALSEPVTGWRGGFDAVLANPPWERLKVTSKDWAGVPPVDLRASRADDAQALRRAGRHPLTGAGELNAYLPFVETCWRLLAPDGRGALIVPAGVAADRSASALIEGLLSAGALERLHLLDPAQPLFEGVSRRVGVAVVVLGRGAQPRSPGDQSAAGADVVVGVTAPDGDPGLSGHRNWVLDPQILRLVNPNSRTAPLFGSRRDAEIVTAAYRRWPVLHHRDPATALIDDDPWQLRLVTPLHMTREARWFSTAPGPGLLPLWEAKHAGLLDHRGGARVAHRYWVPHELVAQRYGDLAGRGWLAGYRNVTTVDSVRTLVPTVLPVAGVGNSLPLLTAPRLPLLLAALASLPIDYLVRQKHAGANLNFFKLEQIPLLPPEHYDTPAPWQPETTIAAWVLQRFATALRWGAELDALRRELLALGMAGGDVPPCGGSAGDPDAGTGTAWVAGRELALAELDAVHAVLLGWDRSELQWVLSTFAALRLREERLFGRFVTAQRVLAAYDRLTVAGGTRPAER